MAERLSGYRILILETREEAPFSKLLTEQGADVLQCPMFTINDPLDPAAVEVWIRGAIAQPFDDLVLMTGVRLRRAVEGARGPASEGRAPGECRGGFHQLAQQSAQICAWAKAGTCVARNRPRAAGHDGKTNVRRRHRNALARRSRRP